MHSRVLASHIGLLTVPERVGVAYSRLLLAYYAGGELSVAKYMRTLSDVRKRRLTQAGDRALVRMSYYEPTKDLADLIRALTLAERIEYGFMNGSVSPVLYLFGGYVDRVGVDAARTLASWVAVHTENAWVTEDALLSRGAWTRQFLERDLIDGLDGSTP